MFHQSFKKALMASTIIAGSSFASAPVAAQSAENPAQEVLSEGTLAQQVADNEGSIVVTGSRIRRADLTSSSPVTVATAAEIGTSGKAANVEDFLNELPQFIPSTTGTSNNPGNGLATIDLRGAGAARTLVLVDGKRYVPSTLGGLVDLNNIPTPLVERVEVVTGGASAVYGSDAMAGVVNFILKQDFSGVQLDSTYRITEAGDSSIFTTALTVGGNFDDGRGNAALLVSYTDRDASFASARDYSRVVLLDSVPNAAGTAGGCVPGSLNSFNLGTRAPAGAGVARVPCFLPGGSTGIPQGIFSGIGTTGTTFDPNGQPRAFVDPDDLFNFAPFNYLQLPQERFLGTALAHYEISPAFVPFARAVMAWNRVPRELAPTPSSGVFSFNLDSPFLQPATRTLLCNTIDTNTTLAGTQPPTAAQCAEFQASGRVVDATFARRMSEVGSRQQDQESYSFQVQAGMRGDISADWNYETYYQYGRSRVDVQIFGDVSRDRLQQALLAVRDASGNIVCRDAAARTAGCVALNPFGLGSISEPAANFVRLGAQSQTTVKDEVANATISGLLPITLLSDEKVGLAVGTEYRSTGGRFEPDEALQRQVTGFNRTAPTRGGFNVKEIFGELSVPLVSERFIHDLRVTAAGRYSDYSNIGGVTTYALGGEFAPIRDIRFRAQYQKAIRAPNVNELFAGQGNNFPAATDVCSSRTADGQRTAELRAACVRSGIPADRVFQFPGNTQVETIIGGNPDLIEEESDTYTAGVVFTPTFLRGFNATVDYYNIKIDNAISTFGGGTNNIIATCFGPQVGGDPANPFCRAIVRRADSTINVVNSINANIAQLEFEGIDFGMDYRTSLPFSLYDEATALAIVVRGTRVMKQRSQADPTNRTVECVKLYGGLCGDPIPRWRLNTSVSMTSGPVGLTLQHRFLSETFDDRQVRFANPRVNPPVEYLFTPIDRPSSRIGNYHVFDASVNFDVNDRFSMTIGVENVFDRATPVPGDAADEQNNTFPATYDPFGRSFFVSGQLRF
jgi:outer membrane receptor protein involved in Fe transport